MSISHLLRMSQIEPQEKVEGGGFRLKATKSNFPALKGMSLYKLTLFELAVREPHWHANADELGYCLKGSVSVTLYASGNVRASFIVGAGESFFIPSGALHVLENIGEGNAELVFQFSNEEPEDFGLSSSIAAFSNSVLGNTWNVSAHLFQSLNHSTQPAFIVKQQGPIRVSKETYYSSSYKYNLEGSAPIVNGEGGSARVAREDVWPILKRQALYSLRLTGKGMREPHWHPETSEMGYVHQGKGRMSILLPTGSIDTYEMNEGDLYFIPKAYPHHIENLDDNLLHILVFFDRSIPADIGFTASVKSNSNEVLGATLHCSSELFDALPTYYKDLLIVNKINPVD